MANFSQAFGYTVYLIPLASSSVDIAFTGITASVGTGATNFIDTTAVVPDNQRVIYTSPAIETGPDGSETTYTMDGTDAPFLLKGLTQFSLSTDQTSEDVITYDNESQGFSQGVPTGKSAELAIAGVADFKNAGFQMLQLVEANTVADGLSVKYARVGPTGTTETVYGYGTLGSYSETNEAGGIVSWSATLTCFGPYRKELDLNTGS